MKIKISYKNNFVSLRYLRCASAFIASKFQNSKCEQYRSGLIKFETETMLNNGRLKVCLKVGISYNNLKFAFKL